LSSELALAIRIALGAVAVLVGVWAFSAPVRKIEQLARLRSADRTRATRVGAAKAALIAASAVAFAIIVFVFDAGPLPSLLPYVAAFVPLYAMVLYVRLSWTMRIGAWNRNAAMRGAQPFGLDAVACVGCGRSSGPLPKDALDSGERVEWQCHHCGTRNVLDGHEHDC